jgi:polyisoprenoid-binding protein YceI
MKNTVLLLLMIGIAGISRAQYKPADQGSLLKFTIKNLGFGVDGTIGGFEGLINFDPKNADACNFDVSVKASTINTDNSLRDEHLRGDNYFDIKNYPTVRMVSTQITGKGGSYLFKGQLTIKGKTQAISFPFTVTPAAGGYLFKGMFKIKRKDFGIGGSSTIADELEVNLNVTAKQV